MKLTEWIKLLIHNENACMYRFDNAVYIYKRRYVGQGLVISLTKENDKIYDQFGICVGESKEFEFLNI